VTGCGRISEDGEGSGGTAASDASTGAQPSSGGAVSDAGGSPNAEGGSGGADFTTIPDPAPPEDWDWWIENELKDGPNEDDERPERPADSSFGLELGEAGWQDSTMPLCTGMGSVSQVDIWADTAGVAVLLEAPKCGAPEKYDCAVQGSEVWFNAGSGWTWLTGFSNKNPLTSYSLSLDGLPGGDMLLGSYYGVMALGRDGTLEPTMSPCMGDLVDDGRERVYCAFEHAPILDGTGTLPTSLASFDGADWEVLVEYPVGRGARLSVIDGTLYVAGERIYRLAGDELEPLPELADAEATPLDVTGTSADDLYAVAEGTEGTELLHLEGDAWTAVGALDGAFVDAWADGDGAYLVTEKTFGRVSESGFEPLATLGEDSAQFAAIHGVTGAEIFLAVLDSSLDEYACDAPFLLYWDGAELHPF